MVARLSGGQEGAALGATRRHADSPMNITMDARTYAELPDRTKLTGMPLSNQIYRDPAQPGLVLKWIDGHWETLTHVDPGP